MTEKPDTPVVEIPLTQGYVAIVDEVDSDLAALKWHVYAHVSHPLDRAFCTPSVIYPDFIDERHTREH